MIRRCTELSDAESAPSSSAPRPSTKQEHLHDEEEGEDGYNGVFEHQMELDHPHPSQSHSNGSSSSTSKWPLNTSADGGMEIPPDDLRDQPTTYTEMISRTLQYGSELKAEFDGDVRREVKKALEETLALIGYEDPRRSPLKHLLEEAGRAPVAEELNRAVLGEFAFSSF